MPQRGREELQYSVIVDIPVSAAPPSECYYNTTMNEIKRVKCCERSNSRSLNMTVTHRKEARLLRLPILFNTTHSTNTFTSLEYFTQVISNQFVNIIKRACDSELPEFQIG